MNALSLEWRKLRTLALLLLILSFCLFLPSLFHGLFADDEIYLAFSNRIVRGLHWSELHQFLLRPANPWEYLPLRDFSYWFDFWLFGDEPTAFHATNLVWYAASALGLNWFLKEVILLFKPAWKERAPILALCGVVVFVVHPAHVEAVVWVASRKDLIAGTLSFFSAAAIARGIRHHWRWREILFGLILFLGACFGKSSAMTSALFITAVICACWHYSPDVSRARKIACLALLWGVVGLAFAVHMNFGEMTGIRIQNHPGAFAVIERASRILTALSGILLVPYNPGFYYDVYRFGEWHWAATALVIILLCLALRALMRTRELWALGVVVALSPWVVYLQLAPFTTWSMVSERFVFVSVAGLALVIVDLFGRIRRPTIIVVGLLLIVLPCAVQVWMRQADWESHTRLWAREYQRQPDFHNAIRDWIVYVLLPEQRYAEATALAMTIKRAYASDVLLALVDTEQSYRTWSSARTAPESPNQDTKIRQKFCDSVANLQVKVRVGYASMPMERDISYNNILRFMDRQIGFRYGDSKYFCAPTVSGNTRKDQSGNPQ